MNDIDSILRSWGASRGVTELYIRSSFAVRCPLGQLIKREARANGSTSNISDNAELAARYPESVYQLVDSARLIMTPTERDVIDGIYRYRMKKKAIAKALHIGMPRLDKYLESAMMLLFRENPAK